MIACNSCGAINDTVSPCSHCLTDICDRCRHRHESACAVNQKRKSLGLGPTVRQKQEIDQVIDNLAALIKAAD